jgi:hypothetical protein
MTKSHLANQAKRDSGSTLKVCGGRTVRLMNHIRLYLRKKWNGQAAVDLFVKTYDQETAAFLGLKKASSDSIHLHEKIPGSKEHEILLKSNDKPETEKTRQDS